MAPTNFDEVAWIIRLGVALEEVAAKARPQYSPRPPELMGILPIGMAKSILHQGYRSLAARAKHDATALKQFSKSHLWVRADPAEAKAILREHALLAPWLVDSGGEEAITGLGARGKGTVTASRRASFQGRRAHRKRLTNGSEIGNLQPVSTLQSRVESYDSGRSIGQGLMDID